MSDIFTRRKRSAVMAAIRSRGNKATELRLMQIFRAHGIIRLCPFGKLRTTARRAGWWRGCSLSIGSRVQRLGSRGPDS